jgi:hypothetical protein
VGKAKSDWRKALLAELVQSQTILRLDWIRQTLNMGDRSSCCRLIRRTRRTLPERREWRRIRKQIIEVWTSARPRHDLFCSQSVKSSRSSDGSRCSRSSLGQGRGS